MASSARRPCLLLAVAVALCLAAPLAAGAATTRYASADGTGAAPCAQIDPCSIEDALSNAEGLADGDTVLLAPGVYEPVAALNVFRYGVTLAGETAKPSPLIEVVGARGLNLENPATVRDLRVRATASTEYGLVVAGEGSVVERVESTGEAGAGCAFGEATVRDTLCTATAVGGTAIFSGLGASSPVSQHLDLVNVTAIGGAYGLVAQGTVQALVSMSATNTIAAGGEFDVEARTTGTATAHVVLANSNFAGTNVLGAGAQISAPSENGNQEAEPLFLDEVNGDYREAVSSPTRLAGDLAVVLPGEHDLAGSPRTTNCTGTVAVDIGAFQFSCPPPASPPTPPGDETKPEQGHACTCVLELPPLSKLTKLVLKPARFVDAGKPPKGTARGTTISFRLSAAASVKLEVLGKRTVKGKKAKTVVLGTLTVAGKAGANHVKFSGKVGGKLLDPGRYTLRAVATASGRQAPAVTTSFTVLIP